MRRLLVRFLIVLLVGGAVLWLVTRGEENHGIRESPAVQSGPLGELGGRTERGPRGVHINPIRDIRVTLLEEIGNPGGKGTLFQSIAEVRGARAEFITPLRQRIVDAVAIYELSDEKLAADVRRKIFAEVIRYQPPTAGAATDNRPSPDRPRITHLRIQAAEAVLRNDGNDRAVDFHGAPPDGVKITLFAVGGEPILEVRTATLRCTVRTEPGEPLRALITSRKRVRMFTPGGRHTLAGTGLHGVLIDPGSDRGHGSLRLEHDIRFEAIGGAARDDGDKPPRTRDRSTVITCTGPAVLRARAAEVRDNNNPDAKPKRRVTLDTLVLYNGVFATERFTGLDRDGAAQDRVELEIRADQLRVRLADSRGLAWADAIGAVRVRSVRRAPDGEQQPVPGSDPVVGESTIEVRGERARLENPETGPRRVRVFAWSFPAAVHLPLVPRHVPPVIEATFRDADTEDARLRAQADGDIELETLHPDPARRQFRVTLHKNVVVDVEGLRRGGRGLGRGRSSDPDRSGAKVEGAEKPSWLPGSSVIHVRDRFVLDHHGVPGRWIEFAAEGRVRIETLLGRLTAEKLRGDLPSRDRWTIEASGYPRLEHAIVSRSTPNLARALEVLSLTPAMSGARPSESSGMLVVEGRVATLDLRRERDGEQSRLVGAVRFRDAVQVTQSETSAEAARLVCRELVFAFARGGKGDAPVDAGSLRADGDVVFEAGDSVRVEGDVLTFEPEEGRRKARVVLRGMPASLALATREGNRGTLEGRILELDAGAQFARARDGVLARFHPARGDFLLPGGAPGTQASLAEVEIQAEEVVVRWNDAGQIVAGGADRAVRIRTFTGSRSGHEEGGEGRGRLMQWAEADRLCFSEAGTPARRQITLLGEMDYPVRVGYQDPRKQGQADFLIEVPVVMIEGPADRPLFDSISGFGPGHLAFGSQDDTYGSSGRAGADRSRRVKAGFTRGFRVIRLEEDRYRLFFPGGGRVESRDSEGKPGALIRCNKELGLLVNSEARDKSDDFRVIEHGYAEGDVFFRYGDDTKGGCDRAFWERGTNILTLEGSPAWIQRAGESRPHTFKRAFYNRATRRFRISRGSGSLRRRFESAARNKKKAGEADEDEPELDLKEDTFPEFPIDSR